MVGCVRPRTTCTSRRMRSRARRAAAGGGMSSFSATVWPSWRARARRVGWAGAVAGLRGVVRRHIVVGPVLDQELHDRAGRAVVAGVGDGVADLEHDSRGSGACARREPIDRHTRRVDLARERIAGGAEAGALETVGRGMPLLLDLDLYGVAVRLHRREPFGVGSAEASGRNLRFG